MLTDLVETLDVAVGGVEGREDVLHRLRVSQELLLPPLRFSWVCLVLPAGKRVLVMYRVVTRLANDRRPGRLRDSEIIIDLKILVGVVL